MPRSKSKSKAKSGLRDVSISDNHLPAYDAPPSSPIPFIPTLDDGEKSLNQKFPSSCARDEPGTKPLLEPFVFVPIPPPPRKRGKRSRSLRSRKSTAQSIKSAGRLLETIIESTSSTCQRAKAKRRKIQVQTSCRVLRPRGSCQLSVEPDKEPLHGSASQGPFTMQLTQGKENETPYWEVSWDKWTHVRGTVRHIKTRTNKSSLGAI